MPDVLYHPKFASQYMAMAASAATAEVRMDLFGEVSALLLALEDYGHGIEGGQPDDASHPIVTSMYETFALRRTPPSRFTPYAASEPVLRIP